MLSSAVCAKPNTVCVYVCVSASSANLQAASCTRLNWWCACRGQPSGSRPSLLVRLVPRVAAPRKFPEGHAQAVVLQL